MRRLIAIISVLATAMGLALVVAGPANANVTAPGSGAVLRGNATLSESGGYDDSTLDHCSWFGGSGGDTRLQLINSGGGVVWEQFWNTGGARSATIDTHSYPNGNYTVRGTITIRKNSGFLGTGCKNTTQTSNVGVTIQNITAIAYSGATSAPTGTSATVKATLTDPNKSNPDVSGKTITFSLAGSSGSVSATTNSSGVATASLPVTGTPRTTTVTASFAGDSYYVGKSTSATFTVAKDTSATTLDAPAAVVHGQATHFTAHVAATQGPGSPAPGGTVQFTVDGSNFGSPVTLVGGAATSPATSTLSTGAHTIGASYSGDATYLGSTAATKTQQVNKAATTTSLAASPNPTKHGQTVTFTATVGVVAPGAGAPTGSVQFNVDGQPYGTAVPLDGDHATLSISNLHAGNHDVDATYNGNTDFASSSSATITQGVDQAETTVSLSSSDPSAVSGEPLTYTAHVATVSPGAGIPSGTVTFYADGTQIGSPVALDASGNATSDSVKLLVLADEAPHEITANYSGDVDNAGGAATYQQQVAPAHVATNLTTSPNPSVFGQPVTLHAEVSTIAPGTGHPTGAIKFTIDGAEQYVTLDNGVAELTVSTLAVGDHTIKAAYLSDDENFVAGPSDTATQTVNKAATKTTVTTSGSPSVIGQPVTFTADVSVVAPGAGSPSGTVTFYDGTDELGSAPVDSSTGEQASITVSDLSVATHAITATYSGDGSFTTSNGSVVQVVKRGQTATLVTSSANPALSGQSIKFTATVSPVAPAAGDPTGTVSFTINGVPLGSPVTVVDGVATSSKFAALTPGTYTVAASYSGDHSFQSSSGSLDQGLGQAVAKGATTIEVTSDGSPAAYGAPVTFTANVDAVAPATGSPSGLVQFWEGGKLLGSAGLGASGLNSATTTFVSSTLAPGAHSITATYVGNFNFDGASASVAQSIENAPTVTGVTAVTNPITFGDSAKLVATVSSALPTSGEPTGSVTFKEGDDVLGTANLAGVDGAQQATLTVPGWHGGDHVVTAVYGGDGTFSGSTSPSYTVTVNRAASTVKAETLIALKDGDLKVYIGYLRATVTGLDGQPLEGQTVQFTTTKVAGGDVVPVCTGVTDENGFTECKSTVVNVLQEILTNGYEANYVGNADYLPASDHGHQY